MTARSPFSSGFTDSAADDLAARLKVLADPQRLKMIALLHHRGEMCVVDFVGPLGLAQPTVSHHLRKLTTAGLITKRQLGVWVYYKLNSRAVADVASALTPWQAS